MARPLRSRDDAAPFVVIAELMVENGSSVFELLAVHGNGNVIPGHKTFAAASRTDK